MKLFSEKVVPTFTSSNQNILTVKDFSEVFFDVYELEINGNKYIAEKVSEYKGSPVVNIPVVIEGKELEAPFVIQRGKFEVIFNESNATFIGPATSKPEEVFVEVKSQEEEVEEIIFEKKESILKEIQQARKLAGEFAESVKQQNLREVKEAKYQEREVFFKSKEKFKTNLLEEFLQLSNNTRDELFEYTEQESEKAYNFIVESVNKLSDKLAQDLESTLQEQNTQSIELFEKRIEELAQNILTNKLLKEISLHRDYNNKAISTKFETVAKTLTKVLGDYEQALSEKVETTLAGYDNTILTLEQSNVELSDAITKNSNKALSRIGNVKTHLEGAILNASNVLTDSLTEKVTLAENNIKGYYDDRIALIEKNVIDISSESKEQFIKLIEESKQSILGEVALIKSNVPTLVTEKTLETKGDVDVKTIKTDLEKSISTRFTQELANVRRIIELSSGGGSVAQQFAKGGTMNGSLNVTGQILSGGVDISTILGGGGGGSGDPAVNSLVHSSSGNWNTAYTISTAYQTASTTFATNTLVQTNSALLLTRSDYNTSSATFVTNSLLNSLSGNWQNTYTTVNSNSATTWNYQGSDLKALSGNWQSTYGTVSSLSSNWNAAYTISTAYQTASTTFVTNSLLQSTSALLLTRSDYSSVSANYAVKNANNNFAASQSITGNISATGTIYVGTSGATLTPNDSNFIIGIALFI